MNALSQNTKITVSDINSLISECNGKLNLSGGTLTGAIYTPGYGCISSENTSSQKSLALLGCSSKHETCASINLKSAEDSDEPGFFFISAKDDTNGIKSLVGKPNGTLTWNGNEVATNNIVPSAVVNEVHPIQNRLCVIKASVDNAPNNGCILSYSISNPNWIGQLFIGDNATQGLYYRGASNGAWCAWKKVFIATEEEKLQFPNGTQMWIA